MISPFKSPMRITQKFGVNPVTYKPFGLKAHEGLDCVPIAPDRSLLSVEEGMVVRDIDIPRDNYGKYVVILNTKTRRAWWYCHQDLNNVKTGDWIEKGQVIGIMGSTGNVTGPHLHLGLRLADANGNAINLDNGYKGFVDPLPYLEEKEEPMPENYVYVEMDYNKFLKHVNVKDFKEATEVWDQQMKFLEDERKKTSELQGIVKQAKQDAGNSEAEVVKLRKQIIDLEVSHDKWTKVSHALGLDTVEGITNLVADLKKSLEGTDCQALLDEQQGKSVKQIEALREEFARQKEELKKLLTVGVKPYEPRDYFTLWIESLINKYFRR